MSRIRLHPAKVQLVPLAREPQWVALVAEWLFECWPEAFEDRPSIAVERVRERCQTQTIPMTWVATVKGEPVGTVSLSYDSAPHCVSSDAALVPTLSGLYVIPDRRGLGVGKALCESAVHWAHEMGCNPLYLYTFEPGYYIPMGWEMVDQASGCLVQRMR